MIKKYISPVIGEGTETSPKYPAICDVYKGSWGSDSGPTEDTLLLTIDVDDAMHTSIMNISGVVEVVE